MLAAICILIVLVWIFISGYTLFTSGSCAERRKKQKLESEKSLKPWVDPEKPKHNIHEYR